MRIWVVDFLPWNLDCLGVGYSEHIRIRNFQFFLSKWAPKQFSTSPPKSNFQSLYLIIACIFTEKQFC